MVINAEIGEFPFSISHVPKGEKYNLSSITGVNSCVSAVPSASLDYNSSMLKKGEYQLSDNRKETGDAVKWG